MAPTVEKAEKVYDVVLKASPPKGATPMPGNVHCPAARGAMRVRRVTTASVCSSPPPSPWHLTEGDLTAARCGGGCRSATHHTRAHHHVSRAASAAGR